MGCAPGRIRLRRWRSSASKVGCYDECAAEACECGRVFPEDALYCCRCGAKRPQASEDAHSNRSPKNDGLSPFSDLTGVEPPMRTAPHRHSARSGTDQSSTTTSSAQKSLMSAEPRTPEYDASSRCSSRNNSNASTSTFQSISKLSAASKQSSAASHKSQKESKILERRNSEARLERRGSEPRILERRGSRGSNHSTGGTSPRRKESQSISQQSSDPDMHDSTPGSVLAKALKHSGSFVMHTVRMRALQAPDSINCAHSAVPKPDNQMPLFEAKVDTDNLIEKLPPGALKPDVLSLQRVSFMSTEWLGIRLEGGTPAQCMKFCLCVAALQNIGKNTSRSVVVETHDAADKKVHPPGFACAPVYDRWASKKSQCCTSFLEHAEDISELADIVLNESGLPAKKVAAELKKWCQRSRASAASSAASAESGGRKKSLGELSRSGDGRRRSLGDKSGLRIDTGKKGSSPSKDGSPMPMRQRAMSMPDALGVGTEKRGSSAIQAAASFLTSKKLSMKAFVGALEEQFAALAPSESHSRSPPPPVHPPISPRASPRKNSHSNEAGPPRDAAALRKRRKSAPELGGHVMLRRNSEPLIGGGGDHSSIKQDLMMPRKADSPRSPKEWSKGRRGHTPPLPLSAMPTLEEDQAQETTGGDDSPTENRQLSKPATMPSIMPLPIEETPDSAEASDPPTLPLTRRRSTGDIFNTMR
mmetsp:Transcript_83864/g.153086  ORF Transcript_83864/g.153086 Transcript_83864/m.153086 type:complete len:703 (+) Transcript_83864:284-2392(+)